ncbi:hypothetical protein GA0115256_122237 [Streptomyces sp. DconLS]|nr:hypothetical protein GA0115256_122237 [Streptomyces sp. DconLS]SCF92455.1 hypothetical protein GA0115258_1175111 [Streptomyces sp. LamerLS-31b]
MSGYRAAGSWDAAMSHDCAPTTLCGVLRFEASRRPHYAGRERRSAGSLAPTDGRVGRKTAMTALAAGLAAIGTATASPASAQTYGPQACSSGNMVITSSAGAVQCFTWDGIVGGSRAGPYLLVDDAQYTCVNAGIYKLTVSWQDTRTGVWTTNQLLPFGYTVRSALIPPGHTTPRPGRPADSHRPTSGRDGGWPACWPATRYKYTSHEPWCCRYPHTAGNVDPSRGHAGARSTREWPARTTCG